VSGRPGDSDAGWSAIAGACESTGPRGSTAVTDTSEGRLLRLPDVGPEPARR